jgi:hypothetical protein
VNVQRKFGNAFRSKRPHVNNIRRWFEQFEETEGVCMTKSSGRYAVTEARIQQFLVFLFSGYIKNTVYAEKIKRSATPEGQNLRNY